MDFSIDSMEVIMKLVKKLLAIVFSIILICNFEINTLAIDQDTEIYSDNVTTTSYMPITTLSGDITIENCSDYGANANQRDIIGEENLTLVEDMSVLPYVAIARIESDYACSCDNDIGTGFMISEKCMLTAAHTIACKRHNNKPDSVTVFFGYDLINGTCLLQTTVSANDGEFYFCPNYTGTEKEYDYGYIVFPNNLGNVTGWIAIGSRANSVLNNMTVNVTGYSDGFFYDGEGEITSVTATRIRYDTDTQDGQSGAPVYYYDSSYGYEVAVGIHTHGPSGLVRKNSGWRITADFIHELADLGYVTLAE